MQVQPVSRVGYNPSFGVLKECNKTPYGRYMMGVIKNKRVEIYDAYKNNEKLWFVSDNSTFKWLEYKFAYLRNGKKVIDKRVTSYSNKDY